MNQANSQTVPKNIPANLIPPKIKFNISSTFFDLTNLLPKNYVTDGSVNYTVQLQTGIDKYQNVKLPNFPVKINDIGLSLRSNSNLLFQNNSKLILAPSNKESYEILRLHNIENVNIYNPQIIGDKDNHIGNLGQWGMGISIKSSNNIKVYNAYISKCWGDGIYIGRLRETKTQKYALYSSDIYITNSLIDNNRRDGVSIISGVGISIQNSTISNTLGVSPKAGLDIEPNSAIEFCRDIKIENLITFNNSGSGIILALNALSQKMHLLMLLIYQ
ncbi:right-handed parallel beta-helix repeat-containing protein [Niabella ginsengisoli]|uniref:Right-handed parallel beta-helix repeat-containing protein n=1 Tax=Niabella ginsengisoli TaxID=522298 RepID=A0ABS9SKP4_9BACT|nr:right-handed parallel beta-helix repeat-containing protein [Niabella ginsengisoli]MCH5598729.1 right-handed parallel beta-helix repeat-containing protein [Niabella ginsengisoli]